MKKRLIMSFMVGMMTLTSVMPTYAAPKQMADGNMFDAEYYATNNPDVVAVLGNDEKALYNHYINSGKNEGRKPFAEETEVGSINVDSVVNNGLTLPVIGQLGVFNIDGTYNMIYDLGNPPAAVANSEGTIVVAMYQGTTLNLNYEANGTCVPMFSHSQNNWVQGNPATEGFGLYGATEGLDVAFFNIYSDATHTVLLTQVPIIVNVLPAQVNTVETVTENLDEILTPDQAAHYLLQVINEARAEKGLPAYIYKQDISDELYNEAIVDFANTCGAQSSSNNFGLSGGTYCYAQEYYGQKLTKATVRRIYRNAYRDLVSRNCTLLSDGKQYFGAVFYKHEKGWYPMFGACSEYRYVSNEIKYEDAWTGPDDDWSPWD